MNTTQQHRRRKAHAEIPSLAIGLDLADRLFRHNKPRAAFDIYEQMLRLFPREHTDILAEAYEKYALLPDRSGYELYQARIFDFPIKPGDKVLDVGSGHIPFPLATHLSDITLNNHTYGRAGVPFKYVEGKAVYQCSVEDTPFQDKEFDFVYCSHVLEHVDNPEAACRELMRISKRGYIETPTRGKDIFLNSGKASNHRWVVEDINGVLVFTEYDSDEVDGLKSDILMDMHVSPQTKRERAFSALLYLMAPQVNTMMIWENGFEFEVRRRKPSIFVSPANEPEDGYAPRRPVSEERIRLLQVHTFYQHYLASLYARLPALAAAPYEVQNRELVQDVFSGIHMIAPYLDQARYDARLVVANCRAAQSAWLAERGIAFPQRPDWMQEVLARQIDEFAPDVIYFTDPITFDSRFVSRLPRRPRLVLGWRAANIPPETDWSEFDVILSNLAAMRQAALALGAKSAEDFTPGFPAWIYAKIRHIQPTHDVVFIGQYTRPQHPARNALLQHIAAHADDQAAPYTCAFHLSGDVDVLPPAVAACNRPAVYGMAMHEALRRGRIAFDARGNIGIRDKISGATIDLAGGESANMRIFEATGSGVFLLTQHYENLGRYFEVGREVETFSNQRELIDKIRYYTSHPREREEMAQRGLLRCHKEHSMDRRAADIDALISERLRIEQNKTDTEEINSPLILEQNSNQTFKALQKTVNKLQFLQKHIANSPEESIALRACLEPAIQDLLGVILRQLQVGNNNLAFHMVSLIKSLKTPTRGLDLLRAKCFLGLSQKIAALESVKEELRYFPDNIEAQNMLRELPEWRSTKGLDYKYREFSQILSIIRPYTMLSLERLLSIYTLSKDICICDLPGNFVECGVAAGGASALLATVIKRHSRRPRRLFCFDTFEGMPAPSKRDRHENMAADDTGWGTGTCASPIESLLEACSKLGSQDIVIPIKGYFKDTLPVEKKHVGDIAFLHMDADWYESTLDILVNLYDSVHEGGYIQIDDYGHWEGCKEAVHEYARAKNLNLSLHPIDGSGVWLKKAS